MNFQEAQNLATELQQSYAGRNTLYDQLTDIFFLKDAGLPTKEWIKQVVNPDARNAAMGAARLMGGTDVKFAVPSEDNDAETKKVASKIEKAASLAWKNAGRLRKRPLHYDLALMALLYGQADIAIVPTKDLATGSKRAQMFGSRAPIIFEPLHPKGCYPIYDAFGLRTHCAIMRRRWGDILARYPDKAQGSTKKMSEYIDLYELWTEDTHYVWCKEVGEPLVEADNEWGIIPIASAIIEGSDLFSDSDEDSRQPLLYTIHKSGLQHSSNLLLTIMTSTTFAIASNPMFAFTSPDPDATAPQIDYETPGATIKLNPGENFVPVARNVIDPALMTMLGITQEKLEESSIYKVALGQSLGANAPFSTVALLSQAGRLPLIMAQRMLGWTIGDAMRIGLEMVRNDSQALEAINIAAADLPEQFEINAELDIQLPQDMAQQAQTAVMLANGQNPLVSKEYARTKLLGVEQDDEMQEQIWAEMEADAEAQIEVQNLIMQAQQQAQAAQQPAMQEGAQPMQQPTQPPMQGELPPGFGGQGMAPMMAPSEPLSGPVQPQGGGAPIPPEIGGLA